MSSSSVANFTDAHAYGAALCAVDAEILVIGKGDFRAELTETLVFGRDLRRHRRIGAYVARLLP